MRRTGTVQRYGGRMRAVSPYARLDPVNIARRLAAEERREQERIRHGKEVYLRGTARLAGSMNEQGTGIYGQDGAVRPFDTAGAEFDASV